MRNLIELKRNYYSETELFDADVNDYYLSLANNYKRDNEDCEAIDFVKLLEARGKIITLLDDVIDFLQDDYDTIDYRIDCSKEEDDEELNDDVSNMLYGDFYSSYFDHLEESDIQQVLDILEEQCDNLNDYEHSDKLEQAIFDLRDCIDNLTQYLAKCG